MKNRYYYWLLIYKSNVGYIMSNICLSSSSSIHKFVIDHLSYLCNKFDDDYLFYGICRTSLDPNVTMNMKGIDGKAAYSYYYLDLDTFERIKLSKCKGINNEKTI